MREFCFDPDMSKPLLNGRVYYLRGTKVCIFRFFEDPLRGSFPRREDWVRRLHQVFKSMHWNGMRYCIGFPPEKWYDIADEVGLLIQDEFPIWYLRNSPKDLTWEGLAEEYTEWIQERWNHPLAIIWDAQNESMGEETGKAIQAMRHLDRSPRPRDNGWAAPQSPTDVFESHPYPFASSRGQPPKFRFSQLADKPRERDVEGGIRGNIIPNKGRNPVIINEYGWLWLNRDRSPTTLSQVNYDALLGPGASADQRRELYARYFAVMRESWRSRRLVAGVFPFCALS
jgi:beta-galactosidase